MQVEIPSLVFFLSLSLLELMWLGSPSRKKGTRKFNDCHIQMVMIILMTNKMICSRRYLNELIVKLKHA